MPNSPLNLSITGIGIVSPVGVGKDAFYSHINNGESGIKDLKNSVITQAGEVAGYNLRAFTKNIKQAFPLAKSAHFAIGASRMAYEDAGLEPEQADPYAIGIVEATHIPVKASNTMPFINSYEKACDGGEFSPALFAQKSILELPTKLGLQQSPNMSTFCCSYELSIHGYSNTIITGGNAFFDALIESGIAIKAGRVSSILCGAADSLLNPVDIMSIIPSEAEKPEQCTTITGEGAVFLFLEPTSIRKGSSYATVMSCHGRRYKGFEDVRDTFEAVFTDAGISAEDIDLIVGSQNGEPLNNGEVLGGIKTFFKHRDIPVTSPLPYLGYTRAAAGAFDVVHALSIFEGKEQPMEKILHALIFSITPSGYVYGMVLAKGVS